MNKLFKFLLVFTFFTTAFFLTGCDNSDDYPKWRKSYETNSLLLKIGIPASYTNDRAASSEKRIVIAGVPFSFIESIGGLDYYSAYIPKDIINNSSVVIKFEIGNMVFYVDANFFKAAIVNASSGSQPNATLTFDQTYNILTAENNGKAVEKPSITNEDPTPTPGEFVKLSINGDTVTAVIPSSLGNITSIYSWELRLTSNKSRNSKILYSGQHADMYTISHEGRNVFFTITPRGKSNLESDVTYIAKLDSAVVYTDKQGDKPIHLTSSDTIYYSK